MSYRYAYSSNPYCMPSKIISLVLLASCLFSCNDIDETNAVSLNDTALQIPPAGSFRSLQHWPGTYEATLPCTGCPGIKTELTLNTDQTFILTRTYLEQSHSTQDKGHITWEQNGNQVRLKSRTINLLFEVGDNRLLYLEQQGRAIEGEPADHFIFRKK